MQILQKWNWQQYQIFTNCLKFDIYTYKDHRFLQYSGRDIPTPSALQVYGRTN